MNQTVLKAVERVTWNTEHHFLHIKNQHEFKRQLAVQFEMGYSDARFIQFFLETQESDDDIWQTFTDAFEKVTAFEYAFIAGGLEGFNEQFGDQMAAYDEAHQDLLSILEQVKLLAATF